MGDAYRIATKVPWEIGPREWSHKFATPDAVLRELKDRADTHKGKQFDEKIRGDEKWGNDRILQKTLEAMDHNVSKMHFGDIAQMRSLKDEVEWWIRKIKDKDDSLNRPEANSHIDYLYTYVFRDHKNEYPGIENWGTCNRRFIAGTTTWSEHCPWNAPDPGCNAIDYHASYDVMYKLSRDLAGHQHVAKILFYVHEWTPSTGWISAPGIDHYDHVHVEGPRDHGGLASACHY